MGAILARGRRVVLRRPGGRDLVALVALARASRALHRPWVYPPATPVAVARWLGRVRTARRRSFLVCRRADGAIAGVITVSEIVRGALQGAFLGYYAFGPSAGQGYMTEGLALVVRHAFTRLGLHRVEANVQPGNGPSKALLRRLGFRREGFSPRYLKVGGRWRDHERWALVREDRWGTHRRAADARATDRRATGRSRDRGGR